MRNKSGSTGVDSRMNDLWQDYFRQYAASVFPGIVSSGAWNYKDDLCMLGCGMLAKATGEAVYRDAILTCGKALCDERGQLHHWNHAEYNLDTISFGKSLLTLYAQTHNDAYKQSALQVFTHLRSYPRVSVGNYWHKDIYPHQVWLDGLYMALPFASQCIALTGQTDFTDILHQFQTVHIFLWDNEKKLYYHAWDETRSAQWANPSTGRSPCFWLRAEGWFLMALTDCYETISQHRDAAVLKTFLMEAVDGLMRYQDQKTKLFYQLIDRSDLQDNYPETSGSAMIAYALAKGVRLGMLPAEYRSYALGIMDGIRSHCLKRENGELHLHNICASAGLGPGPDHRTDRDGSPAYYLSEKQIPDNQHGAAACMMAYAQLHT